MTGLTAEQQFELRAKKALETGDASFKPRGQANKALFEKMKEEFDKKAKEINLHTSSVGDRIIKEITPLVTLFNGSDSTNPQDRINARILQNAANNKANKEDRVLIREQRAKAKAKAVAKGKTNANNKPTASTATASTAAPSEQRESDRDEGMENEIEDDDIIEVPLLQDDDSSDEAMPLLEPQQPVSKDASQDEESSNESSGEDIPPAKPTPAKPTSVEAIIADEESSDDCGERKRKHPRNTVTLHAPKKIALAIHPHANVAWAETCDDTEKENLLKPIKDVTALLKDCGHFYDVKRTFNDRLPAELNWPRGYELNWKEYELAVYIHRESPYPFRLGELLCKVSRKV